MFQSPLGEVVKETNLEEWGHWEGSSQVSIPSRGSGKGDKIVRGVKISRAKKVSIPSRGSGKGDSSAREPYPERVSSLKSTHHFLPVNKTVKPAISSVACKP